MGEERLIEITSAISRLDGPLWIMGYVASLSESDVYLLLRYIGSSKYREMNLYDAIYAFSCDYLKSKNILVDLPLTEEIENSIQNNQNDNVQVSYLDGLFSDDVQMQVGHSARK